jgi:hypothetical protein
MRRVFAILMLDRPMGRLWYAFAVPACVDVPLAHSLAHPDSWPRWLNVVFFTLLMMYGTSRRFVDAALPSWWAVPYSILTLSPFAVLYPRSNAGLWRVVAVAAIALQIPAMLWSRKEGAGRPRTS